MSEHAGQERRWERPTEPACRLFPLAEALQAGEHPPIDCLGVIACNRCRGVFDVHADPGEKVEIDNPGHISCEEGYANHDSHHLDE